MAGQADGSIIIDTELNSDGLKAGSKELLSAIKSLTQEIKTLGESLKELLGKPLSPKIDIDAAEEKVETLKTRVKELENELENLKGSTSQVQVGATGAKQSKTNTSQAGSEAAALEKQLAQIEKSITSLTSKLEQAKAKLKDYYTEQAAIQESTDEMLERSTGDEQAKNVLAIEQIELEALNEKYATQLSTVKQIEESLEQQRQKQSEIAAQLAAQSQAPIDSSGTDTEQYAQLASQLAAAKAELADMVAQEEQAEAKAYSISTAFKKVGAAVLTAAKATGGKLLQSIKSAASSMAKMVFHGKKMNSQFGGLISGAKKFALSLLGARGVYALLRKATSAYMAENQQLSNTLSACWSGIGNLLEPIITKLINLVAQAVAYVTTFLKLFGIFGKSTTKAISSAGGAAADEAEELKRQLASFDELNILSDSKSDSGSGGTSDAGTELPDVTLPDWAKLMVEQIKAGDWAAAATTLATQLNNMIAGVDWVAIGQKLGYCLNGALAFLAAFILEFDWYALGVSLGEMINNIIANVDWANLGVVLGGKFIALIEGLGGLFATLDWAGLGEALSDSLMGLWNAIDWVMVASTISNGIKGALTTITEFLKNSDWKQIGEDIGTAFSEIDWAGIADCAFEAFRAAIAAIKGLLSGLPGDIVAIGKAFATWKISSKLMTDLGTLLSLPKSITVGISLAIAGITLEAGGIEDAIRNELEGLNFAEIISGALLGTGGAALIGSSIATWVDAAFAGSAIDLAITEAGINLGVGTAGAAGAALSAGFAGIVLGLPAMFTGIYDACTNEIGWLNSALTAVGGAAAGAGVGTICAAAGTAITPGIGTLIGLAVGLVADGVILVVQNWDAITDFLSNFFTVTIPGIWNRFVAWITQTVPAWFHSILSTVAGWFDGLWQSISNCDWNALGYSVGQWFANALKVAVTFVAVTIPNWISSIWNSIISALSTFFTETLPKFFTEWIPQAWESVKTFFAELPQKIWEAIQTGWSWLFNVGELIWEAIKSFFVELPQKIWEAIQTGWNWLVDVGKSIIDGIWEGLQTVWTAITEFVSGFVQGFKDALGIHSPSTVFAEIGKYLIDGLLQGIRDTWKTITSFFSKSISSLSTTIGNGWSSIKSATSSTWNNIKSSLSSTWSNIKSTASSAWSSIKSTIQNQGWSGVGSNIVSGIKNGISNGWKTLTNWISQKAKGLLSAAKSALGIQSPSRLFRDEVGLNIGLGIGEGVEDSEASVLRSITGVADAIAAEVDDGSYTLKDIVPVTEVNGAITNFTDKITDGFSSMLDRLQAIAESVTFTTPAVANSAVPYKVTHFANGGTGANVGDVIEASNEELSTAVIQTVTNAAAAIVNAIQEYSGTTVNLDADSLTEKVIAEINRKTRMNGKSPLLI